MQNIRSLAIKWVQVIIWMCVIFTASGDQASLQHSSGLLRPLLVWLFPSFSEVGIENAVYAIRKCAHVSEYAILATLLWRALRRDVKQQTGWEWSRALAAFGVAAVYAITDELHQLLVPSRQGSIIDVLIDSTGAVLGLGLIYVIGRWRGWWDLGRSSQERFAAGFDRQQLALTTNDADGTDGRRGV